MPSQKGIVPSGNAHLQYLLEFPSSPPSPPKYAVIAHPYGRFGLGGSMHDHVVVSVAKLLLGQGYAVMRYNQRGIGKSTGSGSFSGLTEAADYATIVRHLLQEYKAHMPAELVLCGYSVGSMSAIHASAALSEELQAKSIPLRVIAISFPISALWALTLFRSSPFDSAMATLQKEGIPILLIQGTEDQFSSFARYRQWLDKQDSANVTKAVIDGADHFFGSTVAKQQLLSHITQFVSQR